MTQSLGGFYFACEYLSENGIWPKVGRMPFRQNENEFIPPFRIKEKASGELKVNDQGDYRNALPSDHALPILEMLYEEELAIAIANELRGTIIWPTTRTLSTKLIMEIKKYQDKNRRIRDAHAKKQVSEKKRRLESQSNDERVDRFDLADFLIGSSPSELATFKKIFRLGVKQLKSAMASNASAAECLTIFQSIVESINEAQNDGLEVDTSTREELCEAIYFLGDAVGLSRKKKYIDNWREW
ncbi:MAG: hypothetical protein ABL888_22775 [Pirellulaceae bacterium]